MAFPNLVYETDLQASEVRLERDGDNLILRHEGTTGQVVFANYFAEGWLVQEIHLEPNAEGVVLRREEVDATLANGGVVPSGVIASGAGTLAGTAYHDTLMATEAGSTLLGGGGNDTLQSLMADGPVGVVFEGGEGNDLIVGSTGGDTYRFNRGDGRDTIVDSIASHGSDAVALVEANPQDARFEDRLEFGAGIRPEDVVVTHVGSTLRLAVAGGDDVVQVQDWYGDGDLNKIEQIVFVGGTVWRPADVEALALDGPAAFSTGITLSGSGTLSGTFFNDTLTATGFGTVLEGGGSEDQLSAAVDPGVFGLTFIGGAGNDVMVGSYGGDTYRYTLYDGNDLIRDDVRAMGPDVAGFFAANPDTASYQDRLEFGDGIAAADVQAERVGEDLVLHVNGDQGSITIDGWYDGTRFNKIETVAFDDGTTWLASEIDHRLGQPSAGLTASGSGTLTGTQYDDTLTATGFGTVLDGGVGDDHLSAQVDGGVFALTFTGGLGDDVLTGSYAGDTYRYAAGDGRDVIHDDVRSLGSGVAAFFAANPEAGSYQDRLEFGAGITTADVSAERVGTDLLLHVGGDQGAITVEGWYDGTLFNKIEDLVFADGTTWRAFEVDERLGQASGLVGSGGGVLLGSQFNDDLTATGFGTRLEGGSGNDRLAASVDGGVFALTFVGGAGNDTLVGSYAGDTYQYGWGDGNDVIRDDVRALGAGVADFFAANPGTDSYQDRLVFGADIHAADVSGERVGDDLVLHVGGAASPGNPEGSIRVEGWYDGTMFDKIESFVFADGTTWLASEIDARLGQPSVGMTASGGGTLTGSQYDDVLTATGFGTVVSGGNGNDQLTAAADGGVFALTLDGGRGNDVLTGSYAGDVYRYGADGGNDVIHDDVRSMGPDVAAFFAANPATGSYQDRLEFGAGITAADVSGERVGDDLVLHVLGDQGSVTVGGWYDGTMFNKIESFTFEDGTTWLASEIDHRLGQPSVGMQQGGGGTLAGSQYDDSLTATGYGTRLEGGAGNDTLSAAVDGGIFDVNFAGGRGDDLLVGSYARDFYSYEQGDGKDVILDDVRSLNPDVAAFFQANPDADTYQDHLMFGAGIAAENVTRERVGADLVLGLGGNDSVTVQGWFDGTVFNKIELIGFADGTTWTAAVAEQGLG